MSVVQHGEIGAGHQAFNGGDTTALTTTQDDGDFGIALQLVNFLNRDSFQVFDLLFGAVLILKFPDVVKSVGTLRLPNTNNFKVGGKFLKNVEEVPVTFERRPVGYHKDVDFTIRPEFGLEKIRIKPVASKAVERVNAGMKLFEFFYLLEVTGDHKHRPGYFFESKG